MADSFLEKLRLALMGRRHQYQLTFRAPPGKEVLKDLAKFCRAHTSTFHDSERVQGILEGRRQVWLRIEHHLHLSPDELWKMYDGRDA